MGGNGEMVRRDEAVATVQDLLKQAFPAIKRVIPSHMNPARLARIALTTLQRTPALAQCTPASFVGSVLQAAALGLEPGDGLGTCYLIPYGREVQFQIGYQGLVELSRRTGQLSTIYAREVYAGEAFTYELGLDPALRHIPGDLDDPATVTHVYAVAHLRDGGKQFEVMTRRQVEAIRARSRAGKGGPWVTDWVMMARKTVLRRLLKLLPKSPELARATVLDHAADLGEAQGLTPEAIADGDAAVPAPETAPVPDPLAALAAAPAAPAEKPRKAPRRTEPAPAPVQADPEVFPEESAPPPAEEGGFSL